MNRTAETKPRLAWQTVWLGRIDALLAFVAWLLLFFVAPHDISSDGTYRYHSLVHYMERSEISSEKWALIGTFFSAPLYKLGHYTQDPEWWVARYNCILLGIGVLALVVILERYLPRRMVRAFGLLVLTSAMLPHETTDFGAEMFNAVGVAVGFAAWASRRWFLGTVLLALGVANMPASLVGLGLALGFSFLSERRLRAVLPILLAVGFVLGENWFRKGGPFVTGYDKEVGYKTFLPYSGLPDFSYPLPLGVLSLLFSYGKGLIFFSPALFLPWKDERRSLDPVAKRVFQAWALYLVGLFLVYARWWSWYGGYGWGPRFFVFASIPAAFVLAARLRLPGRRSLFEDVLLLGVLVFSIWVGANGITFRLLGQPYCMGERYAHESYCWYIPEFSVLFTPFVQHANTDKGMQELLDFEMGVLGYLGLPLLFRIFERAGHASKHAVLALDPRRWRF